MFRPSITDSRKTKWQHRAVAFGLAGAAVLAMMVAAHAGDALGINRATAVTLSGKRHAASASIDSRPDPRPALWCAWWLRRYLHIPRSAFPGGRYNQARAFAKIGSPAPRGCTDCIAVFSRGRGGHVGLVKGWDANGNPIILSGNFNGRVETAPHPASRLIALRWAS